MLAQPGFAAQDVLALAVGGEGVVVVVVVVPCAVDFGLVVVNLHVDIGMAFRMSSSVRRDRIRCVCCVKSSSGDGGDRGGGSCAKSSRCHRCDEGASGVNSPVVRLCVAWCLLWCLLWS